MDQAVTAESRLVRRSDMVAERVAFIDCKLPGSTLKENYSIIGAGVTQSDDQVVNLAEEHGFALGAAAMPSGVTNNLHMHFTAEVFIIFRGEWTFRWGADGHEGEVVGRPGDVLSIPTWIFRGFTNSGGGDGWIYTALGRDRTGGVVWHPTILNGAAEHGLFLRKNNMMVDTSRGEERPADEELITPLTDEFIGTMRRYSVDEMRGRVTFADERRWSERSLLQSVLPGHRASLAPVIGWGMTEDRNAQPKVVNPHGFSVEWLRIEAGCSVGPFRIEPKQVLIVREGAVEIALGAGDAGDAATAQAWDVFSTPGGVWRTLRAVGDGPVLVALITSGDARAVIEWDRAVEEEAAAAGWGLDPNGYVAPAALLPYAFAA